MFKSLVVDDDDTLRLTVRSALESKGHHVVEAEDGVAALGKLQLHGPFDFVFLDVNMPRMSGLQTLSKIKEQHPQTVCFVMTAFTDVKDAVFAIKNGAFDYLEKPVDAERIMALVDTASQANKMVEMASFSAPQLNFDEGRGMIGASNSMAKIFGIIYKLSKVETSVLIRGESGTGKELVARALHLNSHRKKGPFVAVNCAAIPENLIESELFGHEKGAFTGADKRKIGKFQFSEGGTLFLDEIGDISPQMQVKLLRVLQEKKFTPVGSNVEMNADVRIIAATNRPLEQMIENNSFRSDLFYRLNVLPINLPALRDRREDIEELTKYMIRKFNELHGRDITGIQTDALNTLRMYNWPGNIRELENVIEHAFIIESSNKITLNSLPQTVFTQNTQRQGATATAPLRDDNSQQDLVTDFSDLKYPALKEKFEKEFIIRALKAFNGKINQTAEHTQMTKVTLLRKLEKYAINPKEYQQR